MLIQDQAGSLQRIETSEDLAEARLGAVGFIFHGTLPDENESRPNSRAGSNLLHFARCPKVDKASAREAKIWYRSIRVAKQHLDQHVGQGRWRWCKVCEKEITQKILNEH